MSGGLGCYCKPKDKSKWVVEVRKANFSAFSGYHRTPSAYSQVRCLECNACWRTKATYVDGLKDDSRRA